MQEQAQRRKAMKFAPAKKIHENHRPQRSPAEGLHRDHEISKLHKEGRKPHWRFRLSNNPIKWNDLVHGIISFENLPHDIQIIIFSFVGFTPRTNEELREAVNEWYENKNKAIIKFKSVGEKTLLLNFAKLKIIK